MATVSRSKRIIAILVAVAMIVTLFAAAPAMAKKKKSKNKGPALVKSITTQYYDSSTNKWKFSSTKKYKYNKKGDPTRITAADDYSMTVTKNKFKYKKKKKKSSKTYNSAGRNIGKRTYKKGKCTRIDSWNPERTSKTKEVNSFGKKQYLKKMVRTSSYYNDWSKKWETYKSEYIYKTSLKKGLPKKIVTTTKSNGVASKSQYITTFSKKGLVANVGWKSDGKTYPEYKVTYKVKKGRVVSAVKYYYISYENKWKPSARYTFKYTKTKISKDIYAKMINAEMNICGHYVYKFLWY